MKKRFLSLLCVLALCLGLLPTTALAEGEDAPNTLWVGETQITASGYWKTDTNGKLTDGDKNNYNVYYDGNGTLTLNNATIQGRGTINEADPIDYGIYAASTSGQSVALTINLIGSNTVNGYGGICVEASGGDSTLVIHSSGNDPKASLEAIGSGRNGITMSSNSGNVSLTINNASVEASTERTGYYGVSVTSNAGSPTISLTVNGGSLTAQGDSGLSGIRYFFQTNASNPSISLTVQNNAWVKAMPGIATSASMASKPTTQGNGIVFDGTEGTVYGDVTLDESLTIAQGETLTIPEGSTLNTNGNLTNNGTIVNEGGTLNGEPGGTIVTAPAITTESLPEGTVNQPYSATLEVTGNNITWSLDSGTLPDGLMLNSDGTISGIPTTASTSTFAVTATNDAGSASKEYTLTIKAVSVTSLELNKDSLTLQENSSDTLIATVKPDDATNRGVTWESSDTSIATVSEDGTVTAISAGNATITVTAADGSGISASCNLTVTHGNMVQTPKKDATCTVDGTEEYWTCGICEKHFKDESGTIPTTPEKNKIPATGHRYENGKCTVCSEVDPAFKAMIIEGANGKWQKGSEDGLSFTSNAAFADFLKVQVDGKDVDASNYTVKEGSTIVTLNASYLETLSAGKHTLAIVSDTGTAETEFTVLAAEEEVADSKTANDGDKELLAKTGDGSMLPIAALSILTMVSAAAGALSLRRIRL